MRIRLIFAGIALCGLLAADTLYLRDGRTIRGTYLGGNSRQVRMEISDRVDSFDVSEVSRIEFQAPAPVAAAPVEREREPERPRLLRPSAAEVVAHSPTPSKVSTSASSNGDGKNALAAWLTWCSANNSFRWKPRSVP